VDLVVLVGVGGGWSVGGGRSAVIEEVMWIASFLLTLKMRDTDPGDRSRMALVLRDFRPASPRLVPLAVGQIG
jgi:hypothetical protein